jgi:hypothetical protein
MVGYGDILQCEKCNKLFKYSNATRYHNHLLKHRKDNKIMKKLLIFKNNEIKLTENLYERTFKRILIKPMFICFDFECMLKPCSNTMSETVIKQTQYLHEHIPI